MVYLKISGIPVFYVSVAALLTGVAAGLAPAQAQIRTDDKYGMTLDQYKIATATDDLEQGKNLSATQVAVFTDPKGPQLSRIRDSFERKVGLDIVSLLDRQPKTLVPSFLRIYQYVNSTYECQFGLIFTDRKARAVQQAIQELSKGDHPSYDYKDAALKDVIDKICKDASEQRKAAQRDAKGR